MINYTVLYVIPSVWQFCIKTEFYSVTYFNNVNAFKTWTSIKGGAKSWCVNAAAMDATTDCMWTLHLMEGLRYSALNTVTLSKFTTENMWFSLWTALAGSCLFLLFRDFFQKAYHKCIRFTVSLGSGNVLFSPEYWLLWHFFLVIPVDGCLVEGKWGQWPTSFFLLMYLTFWQPVSSTKVFKWFMNSLLS